MQPKVKSECMDKLLSIIIPAWYYDGYRHTELRDLLDSIQAHVNCPCEVIAVCNSQNPQLLELVHSHPRVNKYCVNSVNVGVARAWNIGSHMAEGEIFCYINEDVTLGPGCLDALVDVMLNSDKIAMVGVEGGNIVISPRGEVVTLERIRTGPPRYCNAVSGFLFLLKREAYAVVGGFDDLLAPCSYEELDMSLRVQSAGYWCYVVPGLDYKHRWIISTAKGRSSVEYLGRLETIQDINERNRKRFVERWKDKIRSVPVETVEDQISNYYDAAYFTRSNYRAIMTEPRQVNGRWEQPLAMTLADMIETVTLEHPVNTVLELGAAYGFVVKELVGRGFDAYGIDFSQHCVSESVIPDKIFLCDARQLPTDKVYDLVLASNIYEHLTDDEARSVTSRVALISNILFTTINKGFHDPSHVNIKSNWRWILFFHQSGFLFDPKITARARAKYLEKSNGTERWHRDCLVFVRKDSTLAPSLVAWWLALMKEFAWDTYDLTRWLAARIRDSITHYSSRLRSRGCQS